MLPALVVKRPSPALVDPLPPKHECLDADADSLHQRLDIQFDVTSRLDPECRTPRGVCTRGEVWLRFLVVKGSCALSARKVRVANKKQLSD